MQTWLPPRPLLTAGLAVLVPLVLALLGAWLLGGGLAVLGCGLGCLAGLAVAVAPVPQPARAGVAVLCAGAAAAGSVVAGSALGSALVVATAGLAQLLLLRYGSGLAVLVPVVAAITASVDLPDRPAALAVWCGVGVVLVCVLARVLRLDAPRLELPRIVGIRHAVATATAAGLATFATHAWGIDHGYWVVVTLAVVLRPVRGETTRVARDRLAGTVTGAMLGIAIAVLAPTPVVLVMAVGLLWLTLAWALSGEVRRQAVFSTPLLIIGGSSGLAGDTIGLGVDRVLATLAGIALAVVLALALRALDEREPVSAPGS